MNLICEWLCGGKMKSLQDSLIRLRSEAEILTQRYDLTLKAYKTATDSFGDEKEKMLNDIVHKETQINNLKENMSILEEALEKFKGKVMPLPLKNLINMYNNKYKNADITHTSYLFAKSTKQYEMDIRNWITPNDLVVEKWCTNHKIPHIWELIEQGYEYHLACDSVVNKIMQNWFPTYKWDNKEWVDYNLSDLWQMPFQTVLSNQGDCEDWTQLLISVMNNRGIPAGMTRNACGYTFSGYGHSTAHYLASDLKWRHIESTTSHGSADILKKPDIHDETDRSNIKTVWYSFNHESASAQWESIEQANNWNGFERNKLTVIR